MKTNFYTTSFSGIGPISQQELAAKLNIKQIQLLSTNYYDFNIFTTEHNLNNLSQLKTIEDIFLLIQTVPLIGTRNDLKSIKNLISSYNFFPTLNIHRHTHPQVKKRPSWRVIAQSDNPPWQKYRRKDLQKAVELGISHQFSQWKHVTDHADLEFWIQVAEKSAIIGLRLTNRFTRHRQYKIANLPGSLRPTIAASLVFLSHPQPNETILDPFCGAGTILIERALAAPYRLLIGSDINPSAIEAAQKNFGKQHQPRELHQWNINQIPLPQNSIDKIITNPPWGKKIELNDKLMTNFLTKSKKLLKSKGQLIFITSQGSKYQPLFSEDFKINCIQPIQVLGQSAQIFVLTRI